MYVVCLCAVCGVFVYMCIHGIPHVYMRYGVFLCCVLVCFMSVYLCCMCVRAVCVHVCLWYCVCFMWHVICMCGMCLCGMCKCMCYVCMLCV